MPGLIKASETYGNNNYVAFKDNNTQERYLAERIETYGVIEFGLMNQNEIKTIDLQVQGLTSLVSIKSVYAFSGSTTNDEIRFKIYEKDGSGNLIPIASQRLTNNEMPYRFPDGAILSPNQVIEVQPRYAVDNIIIYVKPVDILFSISAI